MPGFLDDDFLLRSPRARTLFHEYAKPMPIIDYHCHVSPAEIADNRRFRTVSQIWLGGDHYKWRLMRAAGIEEALITGDADDREKFRAFAQALELAVGNPVTVWAHLELKRYFDCHAVLSRKTADAIFDACNEKLAQDSLSVRGIIAQSNVRVIATTDDPVDDLSAHARLQKDAAFSTRVVPSFRPDKALQADKPGYAAYVESLGRAAGMTIRTLDDLRAALSSRMAFFAQMGCRASDHALDAVPFAPDPKSLAPAIFQRALGGEAPAPGELEILQTAILQFLGREYHRLGWAMQLHYGAMRNANTRMFDCLGPDTGYDAIRGGDCAESIARFLDSLAREDALPKTILYSLNPNDDALLIAIAGCFQGDGIVCKVQHGSAWWHNDTKNGIEQQLISLSSRGLLGGFVGMLTDSRSFLSYARHEYFRRILCNLIGDWIERGECPADMDALGALVQDVSYRNAERYFGYFR